MGWGERVTISDLKTIPAANELAARLRITTSKLHTYHLDQPPRWTECRHWACSENARLLRCLGLGTT